MPGREDRLGGVLYDRHAGRFGDWPEGVHVGRAAEEMHRDDRPAAAAHLATDILRIDEVGFGVDVGEDRHRTKPGDGTGRGEERIARQYDLVPGPDSQGHECQEQGVAAGGTADGVGHVERGGEFLLKSGHVGPEHKPARFADAVDGGPDLLAEHRVLPVEGEERNGRQEVGSGCLAGGCGRRDAAHGVAQFPVVLAESADCFDGSRRDGPPKPMNRQDRACRSNPNRNPGRAAPGGRAGNRSAAPGASRAGEPAGAVRATRAGWERSVGKWRARSQAVATPGKLTSLPV